MPSQSFSEMIEILKKLVSFMNMTVSHTIYTIDTTALHVCQRVCFTPIKLYYISAGFCNWSRVNQTCRQVFTNFIVKIKLSTTFI